MIYQEGKPDSSDLSEDFAEFLQYDTVHNLKKSFGLMGRRFIGQPRKKQIAHGIARYVREHPLDVLHQCAADTLMFIQEMIKKGKGSNVIIGEPHVCDMQIQRMNLVLTYYNALNRNTELYLLDELHDLFAPHIEEAYHHPSDTLQADMVKGLEDLAEIAKGCYTEDDFINKLKSTFPEIDFDEIFAEDNEEETKDEDPKDGDSAQDLFGPGGFSYSCSLPMMEDIRKLSYQGQATVIKAFHKALTHSVDTTGLCMTSRFKHSYREITFSHLEDSLDQIHYAINDLDNAIYEIDMLDPMSFFAIERQLTPIIRKHLPKK